MINVCSQSCVDSIYSLKTEAASIVIGESGEKTGFRRKIRHYLFILALGLFLLKNSKYDTAFKISNKAQTV